MKHRVYDILLVSSLYDAFILEEEGLLSDRISGEYRAMSISSSPPTVTRVDSCQLALEALERKNYDMIITMPRLTDRDPFEFGREAKAIQPGIPVILLLTDTAEIPVYCMPGKRDEIDKVFYWNGDSALFFAITKFVEDLMNVSADTSDAFVRVLLLVEDSPKYYSMFLPIVYREIMLQTQELISDSLNEQEKTYRKRARPKIVLAETFEEAIEKYNLYRENILGVITDVTYTRNGEELELAGFELIKHLDPGIPILVQSSDDAHREKAEELNVKFIGKHSDRLIHDLRRFFKESLGFGDFVFKTPAGDSIGSAGDMAEFLKLLDKVPAESLRYHAGANQFSNWLMARGEIGMALKLRPKKVSDFRDEEDIRKYLAAAFRELDRNKRRGMITDFWQQNFELEETFTRLGGGSLGGKGRGLAFLFALFAQKNIDSRIPECRVRIPDTLVIGTEIFDRFIEGNKLGEVLNRSPGDDEIKEIFLRGEMPEDIVKALKEYLKHVNEPLAVRSSSLLEDSQNQPFAGIYSTFMLPNNNSDEGVRLSHLLDAIKLVYASAFQASAKAYIQNTVHTSEEEKMAIVLQKMVGNIYGDRFYPLFSGVAQSFNFYPVAPLEREDGIVSVALGLGKIIVEGGKVLAFSPKNPAVTPGFSTPADIIKNTQSHFYCLDMAPEDVNLRNGDDSTLAKLQVSEAEQDGTLSYVASTYDPADGRMRDGTGADGPRVITFSGILKYGMLPLPGVIEKLLDFGAAGMGLPVEMEFAMGLDASDRPEFNVLQVRPMTTMKEKTSVTITDGDRTDAFIYSAKALGNGMLRGIRDVVFVSPSDFDNTKTQEMAREIGEVNASLDRPYLLIGPGRWGTRDRFLGIPVEWREISRARAMVEVGLEGFRIDPSHGTHFFHNITSLGIMYFTVPFGSGDAALDWSWLEGIETKRKLDYVTHAELPFGIELLVDGRSGRGIARKEK